MIDPNEITTARVGELPPSPFELTDNIPHEIGETLFRGTVQQLGDTIGDYLGAISGSSYNNSAVPDGGTLPDTAVKEWMFVGKGTFHNVGGQPDIITTEELNVLSSNGSYWSLSVEIPINVELAGITQNIRSGYTQTVPSENAVFNALALKANLTDIPVIPLSFPKGIEYTALGGETSFGIATNASASMMFYNGVPQSGTMWNQIESTIILNFENPLNAGDFMQFT